LPSTINLPAAGEIWLSVSFQSKSSYPWAESGHELAWFQHCLRPTVDIERPFSVVSKPVLEIRTSSITHTINGPTFSLVFSRITGQLSQWVANGQSLLEANPVTKAALSLGFWRPPTDNDISDDLIYWRRFGIDTLTPQLRSLTAARLPEGAVQLTAETFICAPVLAWGVRTTTVYTISGDGVLTISAQLKPTGPAPKTLPRMGLDLRLSDALDNANWFGRGPGESYADKKQSQKLGIYRASTSQLYTPYEVPQENGNRLDTRWLRMGDGRGWGLKAVRISPEEKGTSSVQLFQWAASRYSAENIEQARHPQDLVAERAVLLRLDVESAGVGTGACGPKTLERYQVKCQEKTFVFRLEPFFGDL
jgi:beta-galactosidase